MLVKDLITQLIHLNNLDARIDMACDEEGNAFGDIDRVIARDEDKETMGLLENVSIYDKNSIQKLIDNIKDSDQQKLLLNQYQVLEPFIDEANAYENKFGDLTIREVNATEEGRKEYSKYRNNQRGLRNEI